MFRAIARWFRSLGHFMSGRVDSSRRGLDTDPHAIRSKYDEVLREKTASIQQYKQAVAGLIAQQEQKMAKAKALMEEAQRLESLKAGALAKAQSTVAALQASGAAKEAIHSNDDYQQCLSAFNDFKGTLSEKEARIGELEADVSEYGKRITDHHRQLKELVADIEKIKAERADAVAEVISAKQEKELNDALSGLNTENSADDKLAELRNLRQELKAEAKVSKELSGSDAKSREAEFLEFAKKTQGQDEFDQLIGLAGQADAPAADSPAADRPAAEGKLPE
ncbi:MAG: hypothetical protein PF961_03695 [Planctomycetota bacterium]|jgi:chromosome segregation ATPase|nr:hypothetical protein [Planctomycetota bacterium]